MEGVKPGWNPMYQPGLDLFGGIIAHPEVGETVPIGHTLDEYIDHIVKRARECGATAYIFGEFRGSHICNIHRNQGNKGHWRAENGKGGDGGIFIEYHDGTWDVLLMAFLGQSISSTGGGYESGCSLMSQMGSHVRTPVGGPPESLAALPGLPLIPQIAIVALKLSESNDIGGLDATGIVHDYPPGPHKLHLCNMTDRVVSIQGWRIRFSDGNIFLIRLNNVLPPRGGRVILDVPHHLVTATINALMLEDANEKTLDTVGLSRRSRERSGSMIYFGRWLAKRSLLIGL